MTTELKSLLVWLFAFLALELPAKDIFGVWPWYSLSRTVWTGEHWWKPITVITAVFVVVLLGHLEWHWRVRYLILVAVLGGAAIISHGLSKLF